MVSQQFLQAFQVGHRCIGAVWWRVWWVAPEESRLKGGSGVLRARSSGYGVHIAAAAKQVVRGRRWLRAVQGAVDSTAQSVGTAAERCWTWHEASSCRWQPMFLFLPQIQMDFICLHLIVVSVLFITDIRFIKIHLGYLVSTYPFVKAFKSPSMDFGEAARGPKCLRRAQRHWDTGIAAVGSLFKVFAF